MRGFSILPLAAMVLYPAFAGGQDSTITHRGDSVSVRLVDVDLRAALTLLGRHLDRPVLFGSIQPARVTLETPRPVPRREILRLVRAVVESQNLAFALDSVADVYRVQAKEPPQRAPGPMPTVPPGATTRGVTELFVVRLKHARAQDVAAVVNTLYGRAAALGEINGPAPTLAQELRPPVPSPDPPRQAVAGVAGRAAMLSADVTIVPDPGTNSLLVRAVRTDFELIQAAVQEIDIRPLQVLIEVVIAEVRKDRSFSLGVDGKVGPVGVPGTGNTEVSATTSGIGLGDFVMKVMNVGGVDAEFVLRAAAARGDVRIVSRPVVLAANNQTADITVGSQRPFVQVQRSLPTDVAQRDQVVQYRDVGTQLTVKPTISADGYVMLDVTQEVNQATSEVQFDAPVISTRSVQTQLLVKNGQTVVLGGISDHQRDVNKGGFPVLSRLPLLGALFGRQSRRTTETELFLFLKPVVLFTDEDAERATAPMQRRSGVEQRP